jgi:cobalt ECF transporter T component CbiQ
VIPAWLGASDARGPCPLSGERDPPAFLERTLVHAARVVASEADRPAAGPPRGLFAFDARAKLLAAAVLVVAVSATPSLAALITVSAVAISLAAASGVPAGRFARAVWLVAPLFSAAIALPALFGAVTPGEPLLSLGPLTITRPGALAAARVVLRTGASVSIAMLLARTTGASALLKGLRAVGVPEALTLVAAMTHRYIFVLAREVEEMHLGLLSRRLTPLPTAAGRAFVTSRMAVLLRRANRTAEEVHLAMIARGFDGEPRLLAEPRLRAADAALFASALALGGAIAWLAPGLGLP